LFSPGGRRRIDGTGIVEGEAQEVTVYLLGKKHSDGQQQSVEAAQLGLFDPGLKAATPLRPSRSFF
jgi:hypothetical protein